MGRRDDLDTILVIGSGPIVIGQACEFDYSGVQACKALRREGYRVVLVNSNPATIMTDPEVADATYVEPLTAAFVEKVIARERPDVVLPTLGGQTGLNVAIELAESGVLAQYDVELIGAGPIVIGQACEFDYSGAQACKALRDEGYRVVLVNSNPATIMTDPNMADRTYIEPITPAMIEKIIERE